MEVGKLWFKWTVLNLRDEPIRIDRNQFRLIWIDGSELKDELSLGGAVLALRGIYAGDRELTLPLFEAQVARWGEDRSRGPVDLALEAR